MNLEDIRVIAITNKMFIKKKVDAFIQGFDFLEDFPTKYFVYTFKAEDFDEKSKLTLFNFNENLLELDLGTNKFYYDYVEKRVYNYVDFFFTLIEKKSVFPSIENMYKICNIKYNEPTKNIDMFRAKGLRKLLEDAHNFKIKFTYQDYLAIIKGHEEEFFITENEFNSYKEDSVGDYVTEKVMTLLSQGTKKKFSFESLRKT